MQLFTVNGAAAQPVLPTTLASEGLSERAHLQEWLSEIGLDLTLVDVSAWRLPDGQISVGFEQLYPTAAGRRVHLGTSSSGEPGRNRTGR